MSSLCVLLLFEVRVGTKNFPHAHCNWNWPNTIINIAYTRAARTEKYVAAAAAQYQRRSYKQIGGK